MLRSFIIFAVLVITGVFVYLVINYAKDFGKHIMDIKKQFMGSMYDDGVPEDIKVTKLRRTIR